VRLLVSPRIMRKRQMRWMKVLHSTFYFISLFCNSYQMNAIKLFPSHFFPFHCRTLHLFWRKK
jgi:hypothetical protein